MHFSFALLSFSFFSFSFFTFHIDARARRKQRQRESAAYINYSMHKKHVNYYYISFTFNKLQIPLVFLFYFSTGSVRARPNRTLELTRRDCVCSLTAVRLRERGLVTTRERGSLLLLLLLAGAVERQPWN